MNKSKSLYERMHGSIPPGQNVVDPAKEAWTTRQESAFENERKAFREERVRTVVRLHRPRRVVR